MGNQPRSPQLIALALTVTACAGTAEPLAAPEPQSSDIAIQQQALTTSRSDAELLKQREAELQSGLFVAVPPKDVALRPVERVPRKHFGQVGAPPLQLEDLSALVFPSADDAERAALLEGMTFFTTEHTAEEGAGPIANQTFCLGCHTNSSELGGIAGGLVTSISQVSRASRSTPTNFNFTGFDPATGGGRAADVDDPIHNTGRTASFTVMGDFSPETKMFDPLLDFGGFVQHTRPTVEACLAERIPPRDVDPNLSGTPDENGVFPSGFRRTVGERAAPPYIGRGLMEAIPNADILAQEDELDQRAGYSSLGRPASELGCEGDCVSGRHNEIPKEGNPSFISGVGRFGLRANGGEILQFVIGGLQGELSLTSAINMSELTPVDVNLNRPGCADAVTGVETPLSTPFSERNFLRNTAPPEFGETLLSLLRSEDPERQCVEHSQEERVQRGARLFGVDLTAFANRMIPERMPEGGDDLDPHAIRQADRMLDCVSCHTPVQRTGQSPADVGARHLSYVWAPIFSDLLIHEGPVVDAEHFAPLPRDPWQVARAVEPSYAKDTAPDSDQTVDTLDISRSLVDDAFSNFQASANGREFRTPPLMALGRIGPPFLHDARVYLSDRTVGSMPAGTVTTNSEVTNAPLVVSDFSEALLAAIELHDLPASDDDKTSTRPGGGCPVPANGKVGALSYGDDASAAVCPAYGSETSASHRGEARASIERFRSLTRADQLAVVEFLKQL